MGERGFDEFYAANFHRLTAQIYAYVGDLAEAQDVVQEAFCRGPTELTLTPSNGKYHGTLTTTLHNTGPTPYGRTLFFQSYPDGTTFDFPNQPTWSPCFLVDGPEPMECNGPAVSARGGTTTITWDITADYAPGPAMTLPQPFTFRAVAAAASSEQMYDDPTPNDNKLSVTLKLAAA